jgi:hypothetical protein
VREPGLLTGDTAKVLEKQGEGRELPSKNPRKTLKFFSRGLAAIDTALWLLCGEWIKGGEIESGRLGYWLGGIGG